MSYLFNILMALFCAAIKRASVCLWFFLHLVVQLLPLFILFRSHYLLGTWNMPNSIPISCLYIVIVCIRVSNSFSFYYYYYYYSLIRAFHISDSRWFFTEVWMTASLLKSPGLFLVFWQFSTMLSFGWSPLVRQPLSPLVPLVIP